MEGARRQQGPAASVLSSATGDERRDRGWVALAQIIGLQCLGGLLSAGQRITVVTTVQGSPAGPMTLRRCKGRGKTGQGPPAVRKRIAIAILIFILM
jgi:hypothetical protein